MDRKKTGRIGEFVAAKYLENKGYFVLERNYLKKWGEIDIVAIKDNVLYFVEVKTVARYASDFTKSFEYRPEENIHPLKIKRLHRVIQSYLLEREVPDDWELVALIVYLDAEAKKAKVELLGGLNLA